MNKRTSLPEEILRIEPPLWWIGMELPLQLMIHGKMLAGSKLRSLDDGLKVKKVRQGDSPNYLFADIVIAPDAAPGDYRLEIVKGRRSIPFTYRLEKRRRGSANRPGFTTADMIYLIMPDRFANGDPSNDSTDDTTEKADRSDPFGRHGGDLQGIIDHLDYLTDLGATALWLTPPQLDNQPYESYHGYACADYYRIDPRFGTNELYRKLVAKAHEQGLKVVIDAVPNHCGTAHWWHDDPPFENWVNHREEKDLTSNYRLATIADPNQAPEDHLQTIHGWFDPGMPDLNLENPFVLQYFKQLYIWWIEWADLDGLRVDTYPYNEKYAIADWTQAMLREYPNLNIVAECWHSSPAIVAYWAGARINRDGFCSHLPSVMDFPLQEALNESLCTDKMDWNTGMNRLYEALALDFLYPDPNGLMIFLDNHDIPRFADMMGGHTGRIRLGLTLIATLRGIPQLQYGTEYGFRSTDLCAGHGPARRDFPGGWPGDRKNLFTGKGAGKQEQEIFRHARRLFQWRKEAKAIHHGKTMHYLPSQNNTYSYVRYTRDEAVLVFINASSKAVQLEWKRYAEHTQKYRSGVNVLTGRKVKIEGKLNIPPHESVVIELKK